MVLDGSIEKYCLRRLPSPVDMLKVYMVKPYNRYRVQVLKNMFNTFNTVGFIVYLTVFLVSIGSEMYI